MKEIYVSEDGSQQSGPFSMEELIAKKIKPDTLVWYKGLDGWKEAIDVAELEDAIRFPPPPLTPTPVQLPFGATPIPNGDSLPPPLALSPTEPEQPLETSSSVITNTAPPPIPPASNDEEKSASIVEVLPAKKHKSRNSFLLFSILAGIMIIASISYGFYLYKQHQSNTDLATKWRVEVVDLRNKVGNADVRLAGVISFDKKEDNRYTTSAILKERLETKFLGFNVDSVGGYGPDDAVYVVPDNQASSYVPKTYQLTLNVHRNVTDNIFDIDDGIIRQINSGTTSGDTLRGEVIIWKYAKSIPNKDIIICLKTYSNVSDKKEVHFTIKGTEIRKEE